MVSCHGCMLAIGLLRAENDICSCRLHRAAESATVLFALFKIRHCDTVSYQRLHVTSCLKCLELATIGVYCSVEGAKDGVATALPSVMIHRKNDFLAVSPRPPFLLSRSLSLY